MEFINSAMTLAIVVGGMLIARDWLGALRSEISATRRETVETRALIDQVQRTLAALAAANMATGEAVNLLVRRGMGSATPAPADERDAIERARDMLDADRDARDG